VSRARSQGRYLVIACALLAALVLATGWRRDRSPPVAHPELSLPARPGTGATSIPSITPVDESPAAASSSVQVTVTPADGVSDAQSRAAAIAKLDETIENYRATMVFPLWSRPADGSNAHLTQWNHSISVGQSFAMDAGQREIAASASIDRVFAAPGEPIHVQVTARYATDGTPAPLDEVDAQVQWRDREASEWVTAQVVPLAPGPGGWVGAVVPSQVAALRAAIREARVVAFARAGAFSREFPLEFAYTTEPPVTVRGIASERVVDGQLELGLDVDLAAVATVHLMATLFAADGTTAIAVYDDRYFPARPGRQIVPVRFFGKVLRDRGIDGPYRLGAVHGYVYRRDVMPDQLWFDRAESPAMMTARYAADRFSPAGLRSPETDQQLARYQALRATLAQGGSGRSQHP
jgi:hypothetical protein